MVRAFPMRLACRVERSSTSPRWPASAAGQTRPPTARRSSPSPGSPRPWPPKAGRTASGPALPIPGRWRPAGVVGRRLSAGPSHASVLRDQGAATGAGGRADRVDRRRTERAGAERSHRQPARGRRLALSGSKTVNAARRGSPLRATGWCEPAFPLRLDLSHGRAGASRPCRWRGDTCRSTARRRRRR